MAVLTIRECSHSHSSIITRGWCFDWFESWFGYTLIEDTTLRTTTKLDCTHSHYSDHLPSTSIIIRECLHSFTSDKVTISDALLMTIADSGHGFISDKITLSGTWLNSREATHEVSSDKAGPLVQSQTLSIRGATNVVTSDKCLLLRYATLSMYDSTHSHIVDGHLQLDQGVVLYECRQSMSSDKPSLTQAHTFSVRECRHIQLADKVTNIQDTLLTVAECSHTQLSDFINLLVEGLTVRNCIHIQLATNTILSQRVSTGKIVYGSTTIYLGPNISVGFEETAVANNSSYRTLSGRLKSYGTFIKRSVSMRIDYIDRELRNKLENIWSSGEEISVYLFKDRPMQFKGYMPEPISFESSSAWNNELNDYTYNCVMKIEES